MTILTGASYKVLVLIAGSCCSSVGTLRQANAIDEVIAEETGSAGGA